MNEEEKKLPIDEIEDALTDNYDGDGAEVYDNYDPEEYDDTYDGEDFEESFDGDAADEELEVYEDYDGEDDDLLDFSGGKITEENLKNSTKRETITIENKTNRQIILVLNPGSFPTHRVVPVTDDNGTPKYKALGGATLVAEGMSAGDILFQYNNPKELIEAGINVDAVIDDGIVFAIDATQYVKVTSHKPEGRIRHWLNYIKQNPVYVAALHISSDNTALFETGIEIKKISPFYIFGEERIPFQDAFRPTNYNVKKIVVERGFRLDANTVAILTIPANTTATFTFVVGAELNAGKALVSKITRAVKKRPKRRIYHVRRRRRYGRPMRRFFNRHHYRRLGRPMFRTRRH